MVNRIMKAMLEELRDFFEYMLIRNMPGRTGRFLRNIYWRLRFHRCGTLYMAEGCVMTSPENISIGDKARIARNCCLYANDDGRIEIGNRLAINNNTIISASERGEVMIGDDVLIGPNVVIRASNHEYRLKDVTINRQGHRGGKIVIEDDAWIGANCTILPDVRIGKGCVIGAGAVVNSDVAQYSLAGGVPAKIIKGGCRT